MKNQNEVKTTVKTEDRILNRQLATELSLEELQKISGGMASKTTYCGCSCNADDCGI